MTATVPPGPKSKVFGFDFLTRFKEDPLGTSTGLKDEYGDIVLLEFGTVDWVLCNHPDAVKEIYVTNWRQYGKTDRFKQVLSSVDGQGLVITEGDFWLRQRRIIQPSFSHERLVKDYAQVMIDETRRHLENWTDGMTLNLQDEMTAISLKIAARIFFDVDATAEANELADAVSTISRLLFNEFSDAFPLPDWLPIPSKFEKRRAIETLDRFIYKVIEKHKRNPELHTVVSMLLNARDVEGDGGGMSEEQVRDEAITMFNAGHDSTAAAMTWTWYEVLKHTEIYADMLREVDAAYGDESPAVRAPSATPLLERCIKEALRLYPPAWLIPRQCNEDIDFFGYRLKKGTLLNTSPFVIQRDSRFFENPIEFHPQRFERDREKAIYPHSFFPFGAGPRACIGRDFALMEMQLVIALIAQRFEFKLQPESRNISLNPMVSLEAKEPIKVKIRERSKRPV